MGSEIAVIGSSNVDLIMKMERLPRLGETVTDAKFMQTFGGKGANQAVGAARAGGNIYFVNCVGDDAYGDLIVENLRRDGIHVEYVFRERGTASGTALVMVGASGENYISVAPGANYRLDRAYIDRARPLIEAAALIVLQYEILPDTLRYVIDLAEQAGCRVMLNLAPARPLEDEYIAKLHILTVNELEAAFLCGHPVGTEAQVVQAVGELRAKGPQIVILTLGANGCYVASENVREKVSAYRIQAVDTTAAGDVFCGSLAVALVEGKPLLEAMRFASAAAALSVTRLGAQPSAPTRREIEEFMLQSRN
jgi:ribokinase